MRDVLKVYAPIAILLVAGFAVASRFVNPAPPRHVWMAAGAPQGAYAETAKRYRDILARDGITLEVVATQGSLDNLRLLQGTTGGVDVAFVQGGTGSPDLSGLASIGSVFFEPLWIFVRDSLPVRSLADLQGRRLAIGVDGSVPNHFGRAEVGVLLVRHGGHNEVAGERDFAVHEGLARRQAGGQTAFHVVGPASVHSTLPHDRLLFGSDHTWVQIETIIDEMTHGGCAALPGRRPDEIMKLAVSPLRQPNADSAG
jgi:hypothetical protein